MHKYFLGITLLFMALASLALSACGDDNVNIDENGGNICQELAEVMCHNTFECCSGKTRDTVLGENRSDSYDQCLEDMEFACAYVGAEKINSLDNGRVEFDADVAETCLETLKIEDDQACYEHTQNQDVTEFCLEASLMDGTMETDDSCFWNWECGDEAYCSDGFECVALPKKDQPCAYQWIAGSSCAEGLYCDYSDYTCASLKKVGTACDEDEQCIENAYCHKDECTLKQADGKVCRSDAACESGFCPIGNCKTTGATCSINADCPESCAGRVCTLPRSWRDFCKRGLYAPCTVFGEPVNDCKQYFDLVP